MKHAPAADVSAKTLVTDERPVLVFDSGIGGLTVLRELRVMMPDRRFVYIADDAGFPYGDWEEEALRARIVELFGKFIAEYDPEIAVIACNTASTLVLDDLRYAYPAVPFVGTVPAIKPAANVRRRGLFPFWQRRARSSAPIHATLSSHSPPNAMCAWWELTGLQALRKPIFAVKRSMRRWLLSRSRHVLSKKMGNGRISSCWPARITHSSQMFSADWRHGRWIGLIRQKPLRAVLYRYCSQDRLMRNCIITMIWRCSHRRSRIMPSAA